MRRLLLIIVLFLTACSPQVIPLASPVPFTSIQSAVNAASGTVIVPAGNYPESVRISKNNLTIRCEQSRKCTVKKFEVWGSGNTIEGFKVTGGDANGIILFGTGHVFDNIYIHGIDQYAFGDPHQVHALLARFSASKINNIHHDKNNK